MSEQESTSETQGLVSDPIRHANASFRGDIFQIWHSILAWAELKDDEVLFLEGAEDFDIQKTPTGFEIAQTKDLSAKLTLRSEDVIETINNLWKHRKRNPNIAIYVRFLTTASCTLEKGEPFGKVPGLEMWVKARTDQEIARSVINFLIDDGKLDQDLQEFLQQTAVPELQQCIFFAIEWSTDSIGVDELKKKIERKLIGYGETQQTSPDTSVRAAAHLYLRCCEQVSKDRGPLYRADFRRCFQEATSMLIAIDVASRFIPPQTSAPTFEIPNVPIYFLRSSSISQVKAALMTSSVLCIHGMSGVGKTNIACAIAHENPSATKWIDCTKYEPADIARLLEFAAKQASDRSSSQVWIVDDINFSQLSLRIFRQELTTFIKIVASKGGKVLLTSTLPIPQNLNLDLHTAAGASVSAPIFNEAEIRAFAEYLGCPADTADNLSLLCYGATKGHAQCVHAFLAAASDRHWQGDFNQLLSHGITAVLKVQEEAFLFFSSLLDDDAKELLNRISLLEGFFRHDAAIKIAEISPPIRFPAEKLGKLVGPWIEKISQDYFSVSPLLEKCGAKNLSTQSLMKMREEVATAFLHCQPISTLEVSNILKLLLDTNAAGALVCLCANMLEVSSPDGARMFRPLTWFAFRSIQKGEILYPYEQATSRLLRAIQFRVAMEVDSTTAQAVAEAWHAECYPQNESSVTFVDSFLLSSTLLFQYRLKIPCDRMLLYLESLIEVEGEHPEMVAMFRESQNEGIISQEAPDLMKLKSLSDTCIWYMLSRFETPSEIRDLLDSLSKTSSQTREKIMNVWNDFPVEASLIAQHIFVAGEDEEPRLWTECLILLVEIAEKFASWNCTEIAAEAIRQVGIIYDEKLMQADVAEKTVRDMAKRLAITSPKIDFCLAAIAFNNKRFAQAQPLLEKVLKDRPLDTISHDVFPFHAARLLGMTLYELKRFEDASRTFLIAAAKCNLPLYPQYSVGLLGDAAIVFLRQEVWQRCVDTLAHAIVAMRRLRGKESPEEFQIKKLIGNVIGTAYRESVYDDGVINAPLQPGMCSTSLVNDKVVELPDFEESKGVALILALSEERGCYVPNAIAEAFSSHAQPGEILLVENFRMRRALQSGNVRDLARICRSVTSALRKYHAIPNSIPAGIETWYPQHEFFGEQLLRGGVIVARFFQDVRELETISSWEASLQTLAQHESCELLRWSPEIGPEVKLGKPGGAERLEQGEGTRSEVKTEKA